MKLRVAVTRVFGTNDQYGNEPRTRPPGAPLIFSDFPVAGESVRVDFGPIPPEMFEAERMRRALGSAMLLSTFVGEGAGEPLRKLVDEKYEAFGHDELFRSFNWYASFVLEREIDVEEPDPPVDFAYTSEATVLEKEMPAYAAPVLDVVVAVASAIVDTGVFGHLVLEDRVHLFADGKRPSGIPVIQFSAGEVSVIRGSGEPEKLAERMGVIRSIDAKDLRQLPWLTGVAHWRVQALTERDPWKQFLWSFLALEILTNKLFEVRRAEVISRLRLLDADGLPVVATLPLEELVWERKRTPLKSRFAIVASDLFPESAERDVGRFARATDARHKLAHGSIRDPAELPTSDTQALLAEYLTGSIKSLLVGVGAASTWDEIVAERPT